MIWYLAVFRRVFLAMAHSAVADEREQMWLCQWAAEALHNVPGMLRRYDTLPPWNQPEHMAARLRRFPDLISELGAPPQTVELAGRLVTVDGVCEALGLTSDLTNLNLAPDVEMDRHLQLLYRVCLETRQRWPRQALDEDGWRDCEFHGRNNGIIGSALKDVPVLLVRWSKVDAERIRVEIDQAYSRLERWQSPVKGWTSPYEQLTE